MTTVAKRLREIGNYGKVQIENVAMHLDEEWRRFKQINEQRSRLLDLALSFHHKSHIVSSCFVIYSVAGWIMLTGICRN